MRLWAGPQRTFTLCIQEKYTVFFFVYKFHHLNSESALARAQLPLGLLSIKWFIAHYTQKTALLIKRIGTTRVDHGDRFPVVKLGKVDSDTPWVHLHPAL